MMTFFLGILTGALITIGTAFIFAADQNNPDDGDFLK